MKFKTTALVLATAILCCGCGSIVNDKTYIDQVCYRDDGGNIHNIDLLDDSTHTYTSDVVVFELADRNQIDVASRMNSF